MAGAGFYYEPTGSDRAICFQCGICLLYWEPTDEPWSEHERHATTCPYVMGRFTENVPILISDATSHAQQHFSTQMISCWSSIYESNFWGTGSQDGVVTLWDLQHGFTPLRLLHVGQYDSNRVDKHRIGWLESQFFVEVTEQSSHPEVEFVITPPTSPAVVPSPPPNLPEIAGDHPAVTPKKTPEKPADSADKSAETETKPVDTSVDTGAKPVDIGTNTVDTGAKTIDTEVKPVDTGTKPVDTGAKPVDIGTNTVDTGAKPVDTGTKPVDTGAKPVDIGTNAIDTEVKPVDIGTNVIDTGAKPVNIGNKPVDTGDKPVDIGTNTVDAGANMVDAGTSTVDTGTKTTEPAAKPPDTVNTLATPAVTENSLDTDTKPAAGDKSADPVEKPTLDKATLSADDSDDVTPVSTAPDTPLKQSSDSSASVNKTGASLHSDAIHSVGAKQTGILYG